MPTLDAYIRVSRRGDRDGDAYRSPRQQEAAIRAWAEANGIAIGEVVVEENVSGGKRAKDRELGRLVEKAQAGRSDGIATYRLNRFGRNMADTVASVVTLKDAGARFVSVSPDSAYDTAQPGGEVVLGVLAGLAEQQLNERRENWRASTTEAVEEGKHIACRAPVGYLRRDQMYPEVDGKGRLIRDARLVIDPETQDAVREAFEKRARGASIADTARHLGAALGRRMSKTGATAILRNPAYRGEARGPNGAVNPGAHPAIVTPELWAAAQRWGKPRAVRDKSLASQAALAGIVTCASCGRRLQVMGRTNRSTGERLASYVCTARFNGLECDAPANGDVRRVDEHVVWILSQDGAGAVRASGNAEGQFVEARQRVRELEADLAYVQAHRDGRAIDVWNAQVATVEGELAEARTKLWSMEDPGVPEDAETVELDGRVYVYRAWGEDPAADRHALRRLIGSVTLSKADQRRGHQPIAERVELRWADGSEPAIPEQPKTVKVPA